MGDDKKETALTKVRAVKYSVQQIGICFNPYFSYQQYNYKHTLQQGTILRQQQRLSMTDAIGF